MEINNFASFLHTNTPFTFAGLFLYWLFGPKYFAKFFALFQIVKALAMHLQCSSGFLFCFLFFLESIGRK